MREVYIDDVRYVPVSWAGLMEILDEAYPADVFTAESGDPGPKILHLLREINAEREALGKGRSDA